MFHGFYISRVICIVVPISIFILSMRALTSNIINNKTLALLSSIILSRSASLPLSWRGYRGSLGHGWCAQLNSQREPRPSWHQAGPLLAVVCGGHREDMRIYRCLRYPLSRLRQYRGLGVTITNNCMLILVIIVVLHKMKLAGSA